METELDNFFQSLIIHNHNHIVKQVGLLGSSPDSSIIHLNQNEPFSIFNLFIFNIDGILLLSHHFKQTPVSSILPSIIASSIKNLNNFHSAKQLKNFSFYQIEINPFKIFYLYKSNLILVGTFRQDMNKYYCKLLLIHIFIAITNFKENICTKIALLNSSIRINRDHKQMYNLDEIIHESKQSLNSSEFNYYDYIELKIFEKYLMKYLAVHFSNVFQIMTQKAELFLTTIKLKNVIFIDLSTESILLDYAQINKSKKRINFKHNALLWKQLIHFSNLLADNYYKTNGKNYIYNTNEAKFIKFECTSTFPRYCFFVKFFPLLKGISIVHVYSQNKLSRQTEDNNSGSNSKPRIYKEFDIMYGFDNNCSSMTFELKYAEPPQLANMQHFLIECFIAIHKTIDLYYDENEHKQLPYFNTDVLDQINSIPLDTFGNKTIEEVYTMINKKLLKIYQREFNGRTLSCGGGSPTKKYDPVYSMTNHRRINIVTNVHDLNKLLTIDKRLIMYDLFENQNGNGTISHQNSFNGNDLILNDSLSKMTSTKVIKLRSLNENHSTYLPSMFPNCEEIPLPRENTLNKLKINLNEFNTSMISMSKFEELPKEDVSINFSRRISDINGNNSLGGNFVNARKRSFFCDERIVNFNEDANVNYSNVLLIKDDKSINEANKISPKKNCHKPKKFLQSFNMTNDDPNQTHKEYSTNKLSLMPEKTVKITRFSSLKLGHAYCKQIAARQLEINESFGKVLTFQEQK